MKTSFNYSIQHIITDKTEIAEILSQSVYARKIAKEQQLTLTGFARVSYQDNTIHQVKGSKEQLPYETWVMSWQQEQDLGLILFVNLPTGGVPIALAYRNDKQIDYTQGYPAAPFVKHLTEPEINEIIHQIFDHPALLTGVR